MKLFSIYSLFLAKILTIAIIIAIFAIFIINLTQRKRQQGELKIVRLSEEYRKIKEEMSIALLNNHQKKLWHKAQKKKLKKNAKEEKIKMKKNGHFNNERPCVFVIDFKGSMDAHEVISLREEVTAVLSIAKSQDQVILRLESSGGIIYGYGLASSQLQRLRDRKIFLTVAVDKVAASGGYMMACVANKIVAAPFSIIGSIGVVAQIPNFNRFLKNKEIDIELHTAGQYKRTLTLFGENTEEGRQKFRENLKETHHLFKDFIKKMRPSLDVEKIATGEYWYGLQALEKGLIDEIGTSDELLLNLMEKKELMGIHFIRRKKFLDRFTNSIVKKIGKLFFYFIESEKKFKNF